MIVYTVINSGGSWEDAWSHIEKAFSDKDSAEKYSSNKNIWLTKQKIAETNKINVEYTDKEYEEMTEEEYENTQIDYNVLEQANYYVKELKVE